MGTMHDEEYRLFAKQQSDQQRIDQNGVRIFQSKLPGSEELSVTFNEQGTNDFGIDGELQVITSKHVTGEKFKVQIKSSEHVKYIKGGRTVSFSLDIRSAYSLVKIEKVPTALIIVDVTAGKVFWLAIQIDNTVLSSLSKKLSKSDKDIIKDSTVTVHIATTHELNPETFLELYEALKASALKLANNQVVATKQKSLTSGINNLQEIEDRILELEGFKPIIRSQSDLPSENTVMSMSYGMSKTIDYVPGPDYRPELAPTINVTAKFSMKNDEEKKLAEDFRSILSGGDGQIVLPRKNIQLFNAESGSTLIDSLDKNDDLIITVSPSVERKRQAMVLSNKSDELYIQTELQASRSTISIKSLENEPIQLSMEIPAPNPPLSPTEKSVTMHVSINTNMLVSASHELRIINFIRNTEELDINFIGPDGFRNKLMRGGNLKQALSVNEGHYNLILMLTEIEIKTGIKITYPRPEGIKRQDAILIKRLHDSLYGEHLIGSTTFRFKLLSNDGIKYPKKDEVIWLSEHPTSFTLFGTKYELAGFEQIFTGTIVSVTNPKEDKQAYAIKTKDVVAKLRPFKKDNG